MLVPEVAVAPVMLPVFVPSVQAKELATLAVKLKAGLVPLQVDGVVELVSDGAGLTVMVIFVAIPAQVPAVDVGVTAYTIDPEVLLLGLVSVWAMLLPLVAVAPVMLPVFVPSVQAKVLAALAVKLRLGLVPLQVEADVALVTAGVGFTVTVILVAIPTHEPAVDVGVTAYTIDPAVLLLGLVNACAMLLPLEAEAPVMLPVFVPSVQAKVLAALAVRLTLVVAPLHTEAVLAVVTEGVVFTVATTANLALDSQPLTVWLA